MKKILISVLTFVSAWTCHASTAVDFVTPSIVRVRWNPEGVYRGNDTGICVYKSEKVACDTVATDRYDSYSSSDLTVRVDRGTGAVEFIDASTGSVLLAENPLNPHSRETLVKENVIYDDASARIEDTANGKVTVKDVLRRDTAGIQNRFTANFVFPADEALYGLGSHMEDHMNLIGKKIFMVQHNLKIAVPVLVSTAGWGMLFDAGCSMRFDCGSRRPDGDYDGSMVLEAANELDYYFMKGEDMEGVVAAYRHLTGPVSMMPRYLFGYIQSKERYVSSADLISTVRRYRDSHVPVDMIVQDWNYWPEGWGYMKMNPEYYPDPRALADSIHAMNARLMVSIWPNPQNCPQQKDFENRGYMLKHSVYNAFDKEARAYYWKYADREFFSKGFDAWWCDSSEPLDADWNRMPEPEDGKAYARGDHERRWRLNTDLLSDALGPERANLYSLYHAKGIYENQRAVTDRKRVVNLTRSGYAGQQRYGTVVWNGDTHASWESFRQQIPSGLNYLATGNPYWTVDVGAFFTKSDGRWFRKGDFPEGVDEPEYREFYTRMFQWATFLPVLRSHGSDTPREIWRFGEPGTPYHDAILGMIRLRYSLVPYIYSMAAAQSIGGYSMARPLAFDFPDDRNVFDIKDQYMFGNIMVCPVTSPGLRERSVYLPADSSGTGWIDFHTGIRCGAGKNIMADAPLSSIPLFVKEGTIITSVAPAEYTDAIPDDRLTVTVFGGKDAEFEVYEDDGISYDHEAGKWLRIPLTWNEKTGRLTIGDAKGSGYGRPISKRITVVKDGMSKTIKYKGKKKSVRF